MNNGVYKYTMYFMAMNPRRVPKLKVDNFFHSQQAGTIENDKRWTLYNTNKTAALLHLIQCLIVFIMNLAFFQNDGVPFLTGKKNLTLTTQAIIKSDKGPNQCMLDHTESLVMLLNFTDKPSPIKPELYDFSNTLVYEYKEQLTIETPWMIFVFFLLSSVFQYTNGYLLRDNTDQPRLLHYFEYSITGSLCLVIMAIEFGVSEITAITGFFGLFFAVNMLGACAELLMFVAEKLNDAGIVMQPFFGNTQNNLWYTPHIASWMLFILCMAPILKQYSIFYTCSEQKPPNYVVTVLVLETMAFFSFGFVQLWGLMRRMNILTTDSYFGWITWGFDYLGRLVPSLPMLQSQPMYIDSVKTVITYLSQINYIGVIFRPSKLPVFGWLFPTFSALSDDMSPNPENNLKGRQLILWYMDACMIALSFAAKTLLAWLLLGPAIAAQTMPNTRELVFPVPYPS